MRIYTCLLKMERLQVGFREAQSRSSEEINRMDYNEGFQCMALKYYSVRLACVW